MLQNNIKKQKADASNNAAYQAMLAFNRANPDVRAAYKEMIHFHLKNKKSLDLQGVFFPAELTMHVSPVLQAYQQAGFYKNLEDAVKKGSEEEYTNLSALQRKAHADYWQTWLFGTWRLTQSIYTFDHKIIETVARNKIPDETPLKFFDTLPEWVQYVSFDGFDIPIHHQDTSGERTAKLLGFWAGYNFTSVDAKKSLLIFLHIDRQIGSVYDGFQPYILPLDDMTIGQLTGIFGDINYQAGKQLLKFALSCLLWLCTDKPDVQKDGQEQSLDMLSKPKYTTHKKTGEFVPPSSPVSYIVGDKIGAAEAAEAQKLANADLQARQQHTKRPHIRRGHWHGFWKGKVSERENRKWVMHWIPSIFVNGG